MSDTIFIKYENGEMRINLEEFLCYSCNRSISKVRKLVKIINNSYTPEVIDDMKKFIEQRMNTTDTIIETAREHASRSLRERLDAALIYLEENPDSQCIVSGGMGEGEKISEAECMYRYLIKKGIHSSRIIKEDKSTSTRENLRFSKKIIEERGLSKNIAIATSDYHQYRASKIAKTLGFSVGAVPGHTAWWLFPTFYVRELYGILYQVL